MFIELNDLITTDFKEIRRVYEYYTNASNNHLSNNPSDHYRVDRHDAIGYFGIFPKWKQKILAYSADLKKSKKEFAYVDICGRASGKRFGADVSYLFSLKTDKLKRLFYDPKDIFVDGDLFNNSDFSRLVEIIRKGGVSPGFITFMPMAGLQAYTPIREKEDMSNYEAITYSLLAKRLKVMVGLLRPGGYIMIERPFQMDGSFVEFFLRVPQKQFKISLALKKIARKLKCKIEIVSEIGGPYFLIQKTCKS